MQSICIRKMCILAAETLCSIIHQLHEILQRARHLFCNRPGCFICRHEHDGVECIRHTDLFADIERDMGTVAVDAPDGSVAHCDRRV